MTKDKFSMIHHVDQRTIDEMYNDYSPVFVLSTGRSGSKLIVNLLNLSANVTAYHEPRPTLEYFSNYAFHQQQEEEILSNMINATRMELVLEVFIKNQIYVESNQCMTFFAPLIAQLFKKAKFVHVVRHPGDFVRSANRKGWHRNDSIWESGRVKMADQNQWNQMDQIEKLSWVWNATNQFIEDFKVPIEKERIIDFRIEDLYEKDDEVNRLLDFVGAENINYKDVKKLQKTKVNPFRIGTNEPPNMKKIADFPPYREWTSEMKQKLREYTGKFAALYRYEL
jgi:hypothetical protein